MEKQSKINTIIDRRQFLKSSAGVAFFIGASGILPQLISCKNPEAIKAELEKHELTAWVRLSEDGQVTIFNPAAEMGQGSMTSIPMIFGEEMDVDWNKINVEFSPQEPSIYGSDGWGNNRKIMLSAGSRVTKGYYNLLRKAGAQARYILLNSVANKWEVPIEELSTNQGRVIHAGSDKTITYGEIVPILQMPETIPEIKTEDLKNPKDFRLIGSDQQRYDIPSKVDGTAKYAIDIQLPGMLYAVIERGRTHGAQPTLNNESDILTLPGIIRVIGLDHGVGIIAERIEQALTAKKKLDITWSNVEMSGFNSQEVYPHYESVASGAKKGNVVVEKGNVKAALRSAAKTYKIDFKNDYVYHAQMEPLNAVVQVAQDLNSAEAWVGSQQGFTPKMGIPKVLGIDPSNVKVNLQYLGGGFGRRSMTDFIEECAFLAKEVAPKPLKLMWTREDDVTYGAFRPMSLQRLIASTDKDGNVTSISHFVVGDGDGLVASGIRNDHYSIPNQHAEVRTVPHGVRLKHWRAVGHGPNKFAIEGMIDEIAYDQGVDSVALRRKLMVESPRALATLEKAAEMAQWNATNQQGRAKGVAFLERSGTLSTGICEISLDSTTGKIKVHHFWSASDAGIVIHPDNVRAQIEGGIIMGMSSVFKEQITIKDGEVQQSNFDNYQLLRMEDIPETIETAIIDSPESPQGVGESGTPLVACAVANAFLALTGKRLRHLPFTPERVLKALKS